jgi:hypothetical protein
LLFSTRSTKIWSKSHEKKYSLTGTIILLFLILFGVGLLLHNASGILQFQLGILFLHRSVLKGDKSQRCSEYIRSITLSRESFKSPKDLSGCLLHNSVLRKSALLRVRNSIPRYEIITNLSLNSSSTT